MDFKSLNLNQKKAVETIKGPVLVIAGAGTGKTHVLTQRIANLVSNHFVNPSRILAITFSNKATEEMKNRLNNSFPGIAFNWVNTYHALCLKILKQEIEVLGYKKDFVIVDGEDQLNIIKKVIENHNLSLPLFLSPRKILEIIELIKLTDIDISKGYGELYNKTNIVDANQIDLILKVNCYYLDYLKKNNMLDFNDLINFTCQIFERYPDIVKKWQNKFDYVLVDEFQDTNYKQFLIIKWLTNEQTNNIFAVGDPCQTIYTWIGAYSKIFDDFVAWQKQYQLVNLEKNYRSTQKIINAANSLIACNHETFENPLVAVNQHNYDVKCFVGHSYDDESSFVVKTIIELNKAGTKYSDIAVLYRANFSSRKIEETLIVNQIPYIVYGDVPFYQRMEIKDLLSYFKAIFRFDDLSLMRIINVPKRAIGDETVNKIQEWAKKDDLTFYLALTNYEKINQLSKSAKTKISSFLGLLHDIKKEIDQTTHDKWIDVVIQKTQYKKYLESFGEDFENRWDNIMELKNSLSVYFAKNPKASVLDWINELSLLTSNDKMKISKVPSVQLMTIHAAKGKEYNTVFLVNFNENYLPSSKSIVAGVEAIKEERRIAYVGMTRAIDHLYITCSNLSFGRNEIVPSRFLDEIGKKNYQRVFREYKSAYRSNDDFFDSKNNSFGENKVVNNFTNTYKFNVGDIVIHTAFGMGTIIDKNGDLLDILFKKPFGRKTIIATHKALKWVK